MPMPGVAVRFVIRITIANSRRTAVHANHASWHTTHRKVVCAACLDWILANSGMPAPAYCLVKIAFNSCCAVIDTIPLKLWPAVI